MTLLIAWSGSGFACFGISLSDPHRLVVLIVLWRWEVRGVLVMDLCTCFPPVLLRLDFGGTLSGWVGLDLGCLSSVMLLALFSILGLVLLMPGVVRLRLTFKIRRVSDVVLCWIFLAPCSCLILLMLGRGTRLC